jgi:hypothetical protein
MSEASFYNDYFDYIGEQTGENKFENIRKVDASFSQGVYKLKK